jgi:hypothetical protein
VILRLFHGKDLKGDPVEMMRGLVNGGLEVIDIGLRRAFSRQEKNFLETEGLDGEEFAFNFLEGKRTTRPGSISGEPTINAAPRTDIRKIEGNIEGDGPSEMADGKALGMLGNGFEEGLGGGRQKGGEVGLIGSFCGQGVFYITGGQVKNPGSPGKGGEIVWP